MSGYGCYREPGLCLDCHKRPVEPGKRRCGDCLARRREYDKRRKGRISARLSEYYRKKAASGICQRCGKPVGRRGAWRCEDCQSLLRAERRVRDLQKCGGTWDGKLLSEERKRKIAICVVAEFIRTGIIAL